VLLCELLDGAGNRMSGRCVQRRPGPWPGLDSALPCGFPSVARNAPLATFAAAARFRPEWWWRS